MSRYIKVDDLQRYCDNQKDHSITPNDFQRMNFIELPDKHGRLIDADELFKQLKDKSFCLNQFERNKALRIISDAPTVLEASI